MADVAILGAGPGGFSTAYWLDYYGIDADVYDPREPGGAYIDAIEGIVPGFDRFTPSDWIHRIRDWLSHHATLIRAHARIARDANALTVNGRPYRAVVIATGCAPNTGGLRHDEATHFAPDIERLPPGRVAVVGGGDNAVYTSYKLLMQQREVMMFARRPSWSGRLKEEASWLLLQRCLRVGQYSIDQTARRIETPGSVCDYDLLVVHYGWHAVVPDGAQDLRMRDGFIWCDERMRTSIPGVYVVGDARGAITPSFTVALADGVVAARQIDWELRMAS